VIRISLDRPRAHGYWTRTWDTRVGTVELRVPKTAPGSYFPSLLEPRWRAERALAAVIQEAYVKGISTRNVDDLVRALGMDGISRSEVSRICKELDKEGEAFLNRPIEGEHPVRVRPAAKLTGQCSGSPGLPDPPGRDAPGRAGRRACWNDGAPRGCLQRRCAHRTRCGFPLERPPGEPPSGDVA